MKYLKEYNEYFYTPKSNKRYWGSKAAGVLVFCNTTKKFLIGLRSEEVEQPNTYGTFGGKFDPDDTTAEYVAKRELWEETMNYKNIPHHMYKESFTYHVKLIPLYIFKDDGFEYHNFLGIIADEFEPYLNWENEDTEWVTFNELMKIKPKHFGLQGLLNDPKSLEIIKKYSK